MTERQKIVISQMQRDTWYTPMALGTNEGCMESLRKKRMVKRRKGEMWDAPAGTYSLNVRYEYQRVAA